ncbi:MAG: hypothetical protein ACTSQQ_05145, partial [Candidatus Helarchaeota archaeon]
MGVKLTPLLVLNSGEISALAGKKVVIDGCNLLFKYLNKIRKNGEILYNKKGEPISHIIGFFYFTVNLMERNIRPIFVFDGYPPKEKRAKSPVKINRLINLWRYYNKDDRDKREFFEDPLFRYDKIVADLQEFARLMGCPVIRGIAEG